jgi:hypothetical protein
MNDLDILARLIYLENFYSDVELSLKFHDWLDNLAFSQMHDMIHDPLAGIC